MADRDERPVRVLVVCTANICRSPAIAHLLRQGLDGSDRVRVADAGVAAWPGVPACAVSAAAAGFEPQSHRSRRVEADEVRSADLILAADRGHRAELARRAPAARARTFTLRQAAGLAELVADALARAALPEGAPPLPAADRPQERLRWLVAELDAARGMTGALDDLDIPDPHEPGVTTHPESYALLRDGTDRLLAAVGAVLQA